MCVTPCRLYSEPPEAAASWSLSEQQLVSSLMLFCQKCFGCWCLSNLSLQKFHLQDKRPNTTCCLAQQLENVANSSWLLSLAHSSSCLYLFYFILKHNHQDKVCHFLWLLFIKAQQSVWPSFFLGQLTCHIIFQLVDLRAQANTFSLTAKVHKFEKTVVLYCWF